MGAVNGMRKLVVAGLGLWSAAAAMAVTESQSAGTPARATVPIVAAADAESPKRDADRNVLRPDGTAAGADIEPLTLLFAGLGVGVLLLLRRVER